MAHARLVSPGPALSVFPSRAANLAVWAVAAVALAAWQAICLARPSRLPSFGDVVDAVCATLAGRIVLRVGWLWLGWHLFVRTVG